ncbi:hypothetical protein N473_25825 [Pseudoalteromonas luteoviolacea CPMOR-1]|uniref:Uncharacterized protein n=1 Tax=Pseudoalteromonas luteoviolacea CPMOR-1 TaxID=1365248 RepID=A0A161XZK9_9GAMM|nr:hypothetical protein N473_25825 [Pseudoalteromonas luteoviolacea CPMOR-1]
MKAAVAHQFKDPLRIEDVAQPEIRPGTVLVKVAACVYAIQTCTHVMGIGL